MDVEAVTERADLIGSSDSELIEVATGERRAVVTNNVKDFRPIAARRLAGGKGHGGLILLPAKQVRTSAASTMLADVIENVMKANPAGIADSERWIAPA